MSDIPCANYRLDDYRNNLFNLFDYIKNTKCRQQVTVYDYGLDSVTIEYFLIDIRA